MPRVEPGHLDSAGSVDGHAFEQMVEGGGKSKEIEINFE